MHHAIAFVKKVQKILIFFMEEQKNTTQSPPEKTFPEKKTITTTKRVPRTRYTHYQCKNLKFLIEFFQAINLTPHSYSKLTDNPASTASSLRLQLNQDDMKLSKAQQVIDTCGFMLDIRLTEKEKEENTDSSYIVQIPIETKYAEHRRLDFLRTFMSTRALTQRQLASDLGVANGTVFTWFTIDDISISYLNKIKDTYNANLVFTFLPKKN